VVLGYIDPEYFAGGSLALDTDLARKIIETRVATPLGLELEAAALGVHRVINAQMAEGIRLVTIQRGFDPRDFALVALGGAGPLHAAALARELGIRRIVVPRHPGVLSAAGLLAAPVEHEVSASFARPLEGLDFADVRTVLGRLDESAGALMREDGIDPDTVQIHHAADVCFIGQSYHLEVPLDVTIKAPLEQLHSDFLTLHDRVYGYSADSPIRIVNLRSVQRAGGETMASETASVDGDGAAKGFRRILLEDGAFEAAIYDRETLPAGLRFQGPAIVEQSDATTLLPPDWRAEVATGGALILTRNTAEQLS
jgi:N-methylhydantoinase A